MLILIVRLLQYLLSNVRNLGWAELEKGRYGSLRLGVLLSDCLELLLLS